MVLLHFFQRFAHKRYGCTFAVAHLDHGLRAESSAQAQALADYCQREQILFYSERRIPLRSVTQSSLEAQARSVRYAWLAQQAKNHGFDGVITAHHATDQLETSSDAVDTWNFSTSGNAPTEKSFGGWLFFNRHPSFLIGFSE